MKIFIYILFAALLATACVDPLQPYTGPIANEPDENAKVTIEFSLAPMTKGTMAHDPDISTIHVAVFNQAGVLKQYEKATLTYPENLTNNNNPSGNPKYSVEINMSAKPRILHFIADSPYDTQDALIAAAGTSGEDVILNAITTSGGATAYWQRIELDKIDAYTYQGGVYNIPGGGSYGTAGGNSYTYQEAGMGTITVYQGDYIKTNGKKILDGTGYFQSDYVKGKVANIAFVRNFAEITVSSTPGNSSNFVPKKFVLVNVPMAGYVAPYDNNKGEFCSAYMNVAATATSFAHDDVANTSYPGLLAGSIDPSLHNSFIDLTSSNQTAYMYERPVPNASQPATCVIVGGVFTPEGGATPPKDTDGNTWFKIEIANEDGTYFPIYRGISYDIQIGKISGTLGYASADLAYDHDPVGDISGSVTTKTLTQINDGQGTTLWVEYVDYVATSDETKTIYYTMYYQASASAAPQYLNNTISFNASSITHADANYKAILGSVNVDSGTYTTGTPDPTKQWKKASVTLAEPGTTTKHSTLRIKGKSHANHDMYRDVEYRVMGTQHFQNGTNELKGTSLLSEDKGEETKLTIYLPGDLGMSMFPLVLRIEAENGAFTTVDGLPVESGPSLFNTETSSRNAFYFLKTIEYEDYYDAETGVTTTEFTAKFKTTRFGLTSVSHTNATTFAVLDKVKDGRTKTYFELATCEVNCEPYIMIYPDVLSVSADAGNTTFGVYTNIDGIAWSVESSGTNGFTITSATAGTGPGSFTVAYTSNTGNTSQPRSCDFTLTANNYTSTAKLTQRARRTNVSFNSSNFTLNNNTSSYTNNEITVELSNITKSGNNITLGNENLGLGGITILSSDNKYISGVTVNYRGQNYTYNTTLAAVASPGTYSISGSTGTWTGDSTQRIDITMGYASTSSIFGTSYNFPQITGITVTYDFE